MRKIILIVMTLFILVAVNFNIYQREELLCSGKVVLLELAPVDPRSLMQGDYMALRFKVATDAFNLQNLDLLDDGQLVLTIDERQVASFSRFADGTPLVDNELLIRYRVRSGQAQFATNAFFFQEGEANEYASARYGEFRVAPDGEALLTRMRDKDLRLLGSEPKS